MHDVDTDIQAFPPKLMVHQDKAVFSDVSGKGGIGVAVGAIIWMYTQRPGIFSGF
ncbi:MAG: hypothetical protein JJU28_08135 [Cyclobacteriaceae bacterium]|nr:hypothetical protein [Cyclobacteriaceae bacterium]